ncbi:GNAT family N-acetyltransferase [Natronorubrum sp. JWXQ-INN-674]|uniref:GNAT family N-acetyltransferase n=1 Tax=Natronorubrum halalkaliphilum TaxID=2691917 RepID=A0A6B0VPI7_9EURY|nr:GNAT family N-acetyltransferase [Natronorubrum halalkaliphilum]MXV63434.1 GNAT family N-acetyltransferase [Natronorubrum halalkaliphilum]
MDDRVTVVRTAITGYEDELRDLLRAYFTKAGERGREWFDDDEFGADIETIVADDLDRLASPAIDEPLVLALVDDRIAGSAQLKRLDGTNIEMKRLYVRPGDRGDGIGRRLVETATDAAAADGFETLRLGVAPYHDAARSLYRGLGFETTPQYDGSQTPPELVDDWQFLKYSLED